MVVGAVLTARGFSLLGPFDTWQTTDLGYNPYNTDIGGPMVLGEGYRWNVKTIYYGFRPEFARYYGSKGMAEINKAVAILNALPAFSKMSADLKEFPTDTSAVNYQAAALGIIDLKSITLALLLEEMGVASPERYVWTIRATQAVEGVNYYLVLQRNYDPVTFAPSKFVNDTLYTYRISAFTDPTYVDALEIKVDPYARAYTSVASASAWQNVLNTPFQPGVFYSGLTRDDIGALRYLYRKNNYAVESLISSVDTNGVALGGGSPWDPIAGTNGSALVSTALRPGVDKIIFKQAKYDSTFGFFIDITNTFKDTYILNNHRVSQNVSRVLVQPDIIFDAGDLGLNDDLPTPILSRRTETAGSFVNNSALVPGGGPDTIHAGPGQIEPGIFITFSTAGPYLLNALGENIVFLDERTAYQGSILGSFDGTTNAPIIYPSGTVRDLERQVLGGN